MHGDRVVARIGRIEPDGRAHGEILRVLQRAHPSVVGEFRIRRNGNFVVPHDDRIRQWIEIPDDMALPAAGETAHRVGARAVEVKSVEDLDGMIVTAEILDFGGDGRAARGTHYRDPGAPRRFRHRRRDPDPRASHSAPVSPTTCWSRRGRFQAPFPKPRSPAAATFGRWTSSPSTAKPRAISTTRSGWSDLPNGHFALQVHIADVSHYVRPGSPIDREAAAARHQRLFSGPRRAHAAGGAIDGPMLASPARGPAGAVRAARNRRDAATWSRRSSAAA